MATVLEDVLERLTAICDIPDGPSKLQEQRHAIYVLRNELCGVVKSGAASLAEAADVLCERTPRKARKAQS